MGVPSLVLVSKRRLALGEVLLGLVVETGISESRGVVISAPVGDRGNRC
jgi:hypothetical protein